MSKKTKPALIFIHGFRGSPLGLEALTKHFSDYQIFTPDIPPFGHSKPLTSYTPQTYADFIANFIKQHRLAQPILIGHSMGSTIAAATADKYPELLNSKIIFLSPISNKPPRLFASLEPLVTALPNRLVGFISTLYLFIPHNRQLFRQTLQTTYQCSKHYTNKADVRRATNFASHYSIADFHFSKQALFITGAKDRLISQKATVQLAKKLQATTKFIPQTGHLINYEDPHKIAELIKPFLEA